MSPRPAALSRAVVDRQLVLFCSRAEYVFRTDIYDELQLHRLAVKVKIRL